MFASHHPRKHGQSFKYAFEGIAHVTKTQANFRIHLAIAVLTIILGFILGLSSLEWLVLCATIAAVLVLEMLNTIFEELVDHLWQEEHPRAKIIKDVAAGAVLVASIGAAVIGVLLFAPHYLG